MQKLLSFHGKPELKKQVIANLEAHAKADAFIQGRYWKDGKGCAVGCTLVDFGGEPDNHSDYEKLFGIPRAAARLEDKLFELMSVEDSKEWPLNFMRAVPVGADLSLVVTKFLVFVLSDATHGVIQHAKEDRDSKKAIIDVVELLNKKIAGEEVTQEQWRDVRVAAAYAAAYAAYAAAAYAADADYAAAAAYADYAADAAAYAAARKEYAKIMADKLAEIIEGEGA